MGSCASIAVVCWIHLGSILSDNKTDSLPLTVDACIPSSANFSEIALASYNGIIESKETLDDFLDTMSEIDLDSLSTAVGHAGGFAVVCGFLVRDILGRDHHFGMSNADNQTENSYVPAWVELRNWETSHHLPGNGEDDQTLRHFYENYPLVGLQEVENNALSECLPKVSYNKSVFLHQGNRISPSKLDSSAELASSLQRILNKFGTYVNHPCLGDVFYVILDDYSTESERVKGDEWTARLLRAISSTPPLQHGLRNAYFCIAKNYEIQRGLEELLVPLNPKFTRP